MFCVHAQKPLMMTGAALAAAASQLDACETRAQSSAHLASHEPNNNKISTAAHSSGYEHIHVHARLYFRAATRGVELRGGETSAPRVTWWGQPSCTYYPVVLRHGSRNITGSVWRRRQTVTLLYCGIFRNGVFSHPAILRCVLFQRRYRGYDRVKRS